MSVVDEYPNLDNVLTRVVTSVNAVKRGLQDDGQMDLGEVIDALPIGMKGREEIVELLQALKGLYPEIARLEGENRYHLLMAFSPYLFAKFMEMLG